MNRILRKAAVISLFLIAIAPAGRAQLTPGSLLLTADSLATGNAKDVFKSFFQLGFNRLIGPDKELQFTANPFAVMAKMNPALLTDTSYIRYTHLRNLNFGFSAKLDENYKFNGFASGVKYALVNQRDETASRLFVETVRKSEAEQTMLNDRLNAYASTLPVGAPRSNIRNQVNAFFSGNLELSQLDTALQRKVKEYIADLNIGVNEHLNLRQLSQNTYDSLKNLFQNRPLWTVGIADTTYQDQFFFSNVLLSTEFVKGIVNPNATGNVELNLRAGMNFLDDSLQAGRNLKKGIFSFEPGLNFLLKVKSTGKSFLEMKLSGSYYHSFGTLYPGEDRNRLTLNSTLRIRIFNDIWIPLEIKYDPVNGNVFGFLNVRANFTALGKAIGGKS